MPGHNIIFAPQGQISALDLAATPFLIALLVWLALVDWRHYRLPDAGTLPLIVIGLILAAWRTQAVPWAELVGAAAGFAIFAGIGAAYFKYRGVDGLGLGDAKLLAAAGAWLGWQSLPGLILVASLTGLVLAAGLRGSADRRVPFGPAIAAAFALHWIVFLAGPYGPIPSIVH